MSDGRLGEPRTNRELFDLLARGHVIGGDLANLLAFVQAIRVRL